MKSVMVKTLQGQQRLIGPTQEILIFLYLHYLLSFNGLTAPDLG